MSAPLISTMYFIRGLRLAKLDLNKNTKSVDLSAMNLIITFLII